jgi:hypothetical protein
MGDHSVTGYSDPAANAPDAAAYEKGKGKAADAYDDVNMGEEEDEESSEEEEDEMVCPACRYLFYNYMRVYGATINAMTREHSSVTKL